MTLPRLSRLRVGGGVSDHNDELCIECGCEFYSIDGSEVCSDCENDRVLERRWQADLAVLAEARRLAVAMRRRALAAEEVCRVYYALGMLPPVNAADDAAVAAMEKGR